jgi:hypothetical protein
MGSLHFLEIEIRVFYREYGEYDAWARDSVILSTAKFERGTRLTCETGKKRVILSLSKNLHWKLQPPPVPSNFRRAGASGEYRGNCDLKCRSFDSAAYAACSG